jgi:hypothetical protein
MKENVSYAQILRTVGQMLEGLEIQSFALKIEGDDFTLSTHQMPQRQEKRLRVFWQRLRGKGSGLPGSRKPSSGVLELHYTAADIARMNLEAQAKRGPTAGTPEPHSLSQVLRAVGAIVDQKRGDLLAVRKDNQNIEFNYKSALNAKVTQQFTVPDLYDYWVKMYLRRGKRQI